MSERGASRLLAAGGNWNVTLGEGYAGRRGKIGVTG